MEQAFIEKMKEQLLAQKKVILESHAGQNTDYKKILEGGISGDEVEIGRAHV